MHVVENMLQLKPKPTLRLWSYSHFDSVHNKRPNGGSSGGTHIDVAMDQSEYNVK
jgi:hypothetical protein